MGRSIIWLSLSMALGAFLGGHTSSRAKGHLTPAQGRFNVLMVGMLMVGWLSLFATDFVSRTVNSLFMLSGPRASATLRTINNITRPTTNDELASTIETLILKKLSLSNEYQVIVNNFDAYEVRGLIIESLPELSQPQVEATVSVVLEEIRQAGQLVGETSSEFNNLQDLGERRVTLLEEALSSGDFVSRLETQGLSELQSKDAASILGERLSEIRQQIQQTVTALTARTVELAKIAATALVRAAGVWLLIPGICLFFATLGGGTGTDINSVAKQGSTRFSDTATSHRV